MKETQGKLQLSIVPTEIIEEIAKVREFGVNKYGDKEDWQVIDTVYYIDALLRHTLKFWKDPHSIDQESKLPHYSHMACNLAFIIAQIKRNKENATLTD